MGVRNSAYWDRWWRERLGDDDARSFADFLPGPLLKYRNRIFDLNSDDLLVSMMAEYGLKSVLCAGNGISSTPWTLAAKGADVTVLDISTVATKFAETVHIPSGGRGLVDSPQWLGPGGRVQFVVGDLLDVTVCPGPFDVVIERCTVQTFPADVRPSALVALSQRLGAVGILLSVCLDDPFPTELGWSQHRSGLYHASQSWFEQHDWTIWDGVPGVPLAGRVAWLVRAGSMKAPPDTRKWFD